MKFIENFELFLFDLDGVIFIGNKPIPRASETIRKIISYNKKILFLTNNPARSKMEYSKKLKNIGIDATSNQVLTSTDSMCHYLKLKIKEITKKTAYVIGSKYFKSQVRSTGINVVSGQNFRKTDFVIMGGHREFNFNEINIATILIRKGARLIATNRDPFYPTLNGLSPASGALLSSIETASEKEAIITGKPEKYIFDLSVKTAQFKNKKKIVLIGDNLNTDILGGIKYGIFTVLTLTGLTTKNDIKNSPIQPDYTIKNLSFLLK